MRKIGNNEFFATSRGAKTAATKRGYAIGARVMETTSGFCLLAVGEGADSYSYAIISQGAICAELTDRGWLGEDFLRGNDSV